MPIDLSVETLVELRKASEYLPGRPHVSTLYRWIQRRRKPLEYIKIGGRTYTSVEALQRFAEACTLAESNAMSQRQAPIARALADLDRLGI